MRRCLICVGIGLAVAGCATVESVDQMAPRTIEVVCTAMRPKSPEGLSGISRIEGNRYYCVDDRGGMLCEAEIVLDPPKPDLRFKVLREVKLQGRKDLEGCAYDPLDGRVWVSDESDHSIRQFDPITGSETARVEIPDVYRGNMRPNLSFEALTISPDGLEMYVANEDTLKCDGPVADAKHGGLVRIQAFRRTGAGCPWIPTQQYFYPTERVEGLKYAGLAISGVVALCAPGDGTLYVLEREMSQKNPLYPSFRAWLFKLELADGRKPVKKVSVWKEDTLFANYEGMCLGPELKDASRSLILISDGGGMAEELILALALPGK